MYCILLLAAVLVTVLHPWWLIAPLAFLIGGFCTRSASRAAIIGFAAVFTAWLACACYYSLPNHQLLATRMAGFFLLPNAWTLIITAAIPGALTGGLSAASGVLVRAMFKRNKPV